MSALLCTDPAQRQGRGLGGRLGDKYLNSRLHASHRASEKAVNEGVALQQLNTSYLCHAAQPTVLGAGHRNLVATWEATLVGCCLELMEA